MSQSENNVQNKNWNKSWKKKKSAKKQNNETNIALAHSNSLHGYPDPFADDSNNASKKIRNEPVSKGPFVLEAKNARNSKLNFNAWQKAMQIHIGTLYPECSVEILPRADGIRYNLVRPIRPVQPELLPSNAANAAHNSMVSAIYQTELTQFFSIDHALTLSQVKAIMEVRKYLESRIDDEVISAHPTYAQQPNLVSVMNTIETTCQLLSVGGNTQQLKMHVEIKDAHMFSGMAAIDNMKRNNKEFNLHQHREDFKQLEDERVILKLPARDGFEQASRFMMSLALVSKYKLMVHNIFEAESEYESMPKTTPEEILEANKVRKMPKDLSAAYKRASEQRDLKMVFDDPFMKSSQGSSFANYSSDSQTNGGANSKKNKKGNKGKVSGKDTSTTSSNTKGSVPEEKKHCDIHGVCTHNTIECKNLPQVILSWKLGQTKNQKGKTYPKRNTKDSDADDDEPIAKGVRKSNVDRYFNTKYYEDDDDYPVSHMTLLQRAQKLGCRFERYDAIIDNACSSTLTTLNDRNLVTNVRVSSNDQIISTSNGDKHTEGTLIADSHCFGEVFVEDQDVSILSQSLLESLYHLNVVQENGFVICYELYIEPFGLLLRFNKKQDGIFVANLKCLLGREFIINPPKRELPRSLCYQTALGTVDELNTSEPIKPTIKRKKQSVVSKKDLDRYKYAMNKVQPCFAFISPADYEHSVNSNVFINAPVEANALRKAVEYLGPSIPYLKGKGTKKKKKSHFKEEINALQPNEVFHQMDLAYINELVFLFSTINPIFYSIISFLGYGKGIRVASNILPHLQHHYAVYTSLGVKVKLSTSDGEGAIAQLSTEINKLGIRYEKLAKGQHAIYVDSMIKKWKSSLRCIFHMGIPMIRAFRIQAAMTVMFFQNRICNTSNPNKESPHYSLTKERLDCSKINFAFGDLVEAAVEDDIQHNSMNERRKTCIVMGPANTPGTYNLYDIQTRKIIKRNDLVQIPMLPDVIELLKDIEAEENRKLVTHPDYTVVAPIQHKRITDYRELYLPYQVAKYGVLPSVKALAKELRGMYEHFGSFQPVYQHELTPEELIDTLKSRGMLTVKPDKEGNPDLKGRFIVKGNTQDRSKYDLEDLNSPTVAISTIFQLLITAAKEKLDVVIVDHPQAFLKAKQDKVQIVKMDKHIAALFVQMYPEFKDYLLSDGSLLIKLLKAIYGQIDAPMLFYKYLSTKLEDLGHLVNPIDRGLFKKVYHEVTKYYNIVETGTHVDDTLSIVVRELRQRLKDEFKAEFGDDLKINDDQDNLIFLGMWIRLYHEKQQVHITGEIFFNKLCDDNADLIQRKTRKYPCRLDMFTADVNSSLLTDKTLSDRITKIIYQCGYATFIAPEISVAVTVLKASVNEVTEQVYERTVYLLQYINGRRDLPLILGPNSKGEYEFLTFSDAASNPGNDTSPFLKGCRSVSASVNSLGRGGFKVKVAKQSVVTNSSTYAELVAVNDAMIPSSNQQQILESRGITGKGIKPGKFKEDNTATIQLIKNGRSLSAKTKHIKLKYYFIKHYFDNGDFELEYCPTEDMVADILTKPLQGKLFFKLRAMLLGHVPMV